MLWIITKLNWLVPTIEWCYLFSKVKLNFSYFVRIVCFLWFCSRVCFWVLLLCVCFFWFKFLVIVFRICSGGTKFSNSWFGCMINNDIWLSETFLWKDYTSGVRVIINENGLFSSCFIRGLILIGMLIWALK